MDIEKCPIIDFWAYLIAILIFFGEISGKLVHEYTEFLESKNPKICKIEEIWNIFLKGHTFSLFYHVLVKNINFPEEIYPLTI